MWRAACGPRSALPPYFSASGLLSKPPHGGPGGGEPNPSRHAFQSLPSSTSNHSAGFSACLHHRGMSTSRVEWLGTEVACACVPSFHGSVGEFRRSRTVRSCSPDRTRAGIPAATERARVACCASARFVLSIAKQQRDPFSRGHWRCDLALVAVRRVKDAG